MYVCVTKEGKVIAHFNSQHGFGGMKWGEYIGTKYGKKILQILQNEYCDADCKWITVSDYGYSDDDEFTDGEALYDAAKVTRAIGILGCFRAKALEQNLTTQEMINFWDNILRTFKKHGFLEMANAECVCSNDEASGGDFNDEAPPKKKKKDKDAKKAKTGMPSN